MRKIIFASTNENKFNEILLHLRNFDFEIEFIRFNTIEIQSEILEDIALEKSKRAFEKIGKSLIVEDTGLFIDSLNGFPGPYSSYVLKTIGNRGILDLLSNKSNRLALFRSVIAYNDGKNNLTFSGETRGTISNDISEVGWGYDPIFIPQGSSITYGQQDITDKINISHRTHALNRFAEWYCRNYTK
ncbi:MAG TPA: RdgB/HAM1 family non-canonical purine NTP pyrophosphatase [Nitrososphaeraceae archaeon]|nr:RdgB/HAM1 family non-canonical purine NTP pyrophosphatase [Nitrososphaeraceae archaeon]